MNPRLLDTDRFHRRVFLKFPAEGLVQQRFLQSLQRGELLLVEIGEELGFFGEVVGWLIVGLQVSWAASYGSQGTNESQAVQFSGESAAAHHSP